MRYPPGVELPPELEDVHRRAVRLEWLTIAYLLTAILAIYFTLGSSQAMKGAWLAAETLDMVFSHSMSSLLELNS